MLEKFCQTSYGHVDRGGGAWRPANFRAAGSDRLCLKEISPAVEQLNRPYQIRGVVGTGQQRGRTIGFSHREFDTSSRCCSADGVYAVGVRFAGGVYLSARHIVQSTFGENVRKIEVHLLIFPGTWLGDSGDRFFERCRKPGGFARIEDLVSQLHQDVQHVRELDQAT